MNQDVVLIVFQVIVLVFAFSVHEAAHAYAAMRLGDATAYMLGRVTLNPIKHIDPVGSIIMPLVAMFSGFPLLGWAKPCPVTLRNFRKVKRDDIITTAAGPLSNLAIAVIALILLVIMKHVPGMGADAVYTAMDVAAHIPSDLTGVPALFPIALLLYYSILTNVLLFCFNLIPLPPLDGSRILQYFLPYSMRNFYERVGNYGIILVFLFAGRLMMPIYRPLLGLFDSMLQSL